METIPFALCLSGKPAYPAYTSYGIMLPGGMCTVFLLNIKKISGFPGNSRATTDADF